MKIDLIRELIKPYLNGSQLTYRVFEELFDKQFKLSNKEQYQLIELLANEGIELVDDEITEERISGDGATLDREADEFQIQYDESIFQDSPEFEKEDVNYSNIKQSNENLCIMIHQGNKQARSDLCIKNKRLVQSFAAKYQHFFGNKLEFEDLEQAGFYGLIVAAERFKPEAGNHFSTYAVFWIRQAILREIMNNGFMIRLPVYIMDYIIRIGRLETQLEGKFLSPNEMISAIAVEMDLSEERIIELLMIRKNVLSTSSLNTPIGEEMDTELEDLLPAPEINTPEDNATNSEMREIMESVLNTLTPREAMVLRMRYGFDGEQPQTLEEVGKKLKLTRERIRQIESKAMRKLRHPSRSKKLKDFLE